jgi:hypothetical protein
MDSFEILRRAQQPQELADERKRDAKKLIHAMQVRDDDVSARMAKLKALRLAKEAEELANAPPPVVKKKPVPRSGAKAKA